jgi:aminoglycoside phosphotransferase family enzyme
MLKFHEESKLLMQIRDIQHELNIVKTVVEQQESVIDQLSRAISAFHQNSTRRHWKRNSDELEIPRQRGKAPISMR